MKNLIKSISSKGISSVKGLALVSDTSYEVIFYGIINGKTIQSNTMVEEDLIDSVFLDKIYNDIASCIKKTSDYDNNKLNIVEFNDNGIVSHKKENRDYSVYKVIKEWEKNIGQ